MSFVELAPTRRRTGTGVRLSLTERSGVILSLTGAAVEAIGGGQEGAVKVYLDQDPALPRMRVERHKDGPFHVTPAPRGSETRLVRVGHVKAITAPPVSGLDCTWEGVEGRAAIDIDLPRAFFADRTVTTEARLQPHSSAARGRTTQVTLPRVGAGDAPARA
jgi:hypothetical protein